MTFQLWMYEAKKGGSPYLVDEDESSEELVEMLDAMLSIGRDFGIRYTEEGPQNYVSSRGDRLVILPKTGGHSCN